MLEPFYVKSETGEKDFEQPQTLWYRKNRANCAVYFTKTLIHRLPF
jgi:hypothetical protein